MRYFVIGLLALCLASGAAQAALKFPVLTGRVVDQAHILTPATVQTLANDLDALEKKTGHQLVVVTVDTLQGLEIEEYGVQLGRQWAIGRKDKNDGALLIVAPNERKLRIEVGYGLEGTLTDAMGSRIIQTVILPEFKRGDMERGIINGVHAIIGQINGDPLEAPPSEDMPAWSIALFLAAIFCNTTKTILYLLLLPLALLLRPTKPTLYAGLEQRRKTLWAQLRKFPFLPLLIVFPIWMLIPIFFYNKRSYGGGGFSGGGFGGSSGGGGFSGGGGSFGGGGSSGRW